MAITKKTNNEENTMKYDITVTRATERANKPDCYRFSMTVNGITINSCDYITYTDRSGVRKSFVAFPQYKGSDGKYYNLAWFKISDEDFKIIEQQIEDIINNKG